MLIQLISGRNYMHAERWHCRYLWISDNVNHKYWPGESCWTCSL